MIRTEINLTFAEAALSALERALGDMTPVMDDIGDSLVGRTRDRFKTSTGVDGIPWAPKSPITIATQIASKSTRPLIRDGTLAEQIFHQAGPDSVEWGSNLIQAAVMQFGAAQGAFGKTSRGGPIPWGNIPARPYIGVSDEDETMIAETLTDWLARAAGQSV